MMLNSELVVAVRRQERDLGCFTEGSPASPAGQQVVARRPQYI